MHGTGKEGGYHSNWGCFEHNYRSTWRKKVEQIWQRASSLGKKEFLYIFYESYEENNIGVHNNLGKIIHSYIINTPINIPCQNQIFEES